MSIATDMEAARVAHTRVILANPRVRLGAGRVPTTSPPAADPRHGSSACAEDDTGGMGMPMGCAA
jgi:hypothetical protein